MKPKINYILFILLILFFSCSKLGIDLDPPQIKDYYPHHNQYKVPNSASIWIEFTEAMDKISVENAFDIQSEGDTSGNFYWESESKVFYIFEKELTTGKQYTITISKFAKDKTGNSLTSDFIFSFYVNNDITVPVVTKTIPENLSEGVSKDSDIYIYFSEPMDYKSVQNNFSISPEVKGLFQWTNNYTILHYRLLDTLDASTRYIVIIGADSADMAGNKLGEDYKFNFLTGDTYSYPEILGVYRYGDITLPIEARYWTNYQQNLNKNIQIAVHFNKPMSHIDVEKAFSLSPPIAGYFTWSTTEGETLIFNPTEDFQPETTYKLLISSSAKDLDEHQLFSDFELFFVINGTNSQYLKITNITDNLLNPLSFDTITEVNLQGTNTNTFTIKFNLISPNKLDVSSFQGNVSISRIGGWGDSAYSGAIYDFNYNLDYTIAYITLGDLSPNNYYKLKFNGGESGIKDIYKNYLKEDVEIIFLTK